MEADQEEVVDEDNQHNENGGEVLDEAQLHGGRDESMVDGGRDEPPENGGRDEPAENGGRDKPPENGGRDELAENRGRDEDNVELDDNYTDVLHSFSEKWLKTQLTHRVSAKATNTFWDLCQQYFPKLNEMKEREGRQNKIPKFTQQRRKLYSKYCPDVKMEFAFRKKDDGTIKIFKGSSAPLKTIQLSSEYTKLYEISYIKVR